jgi:hypothetical protein
VTALILDAGALIGIDRGDRSVLARLEMARRRGVELRSNGVVVAQVWRDRSGRQAELAKALRAVDVRAVGLDEGKAAGVLLGSAGLHDAVDATVVALASDGDQILTSDKSDLAALVAASGRAIRVVQV